MRTVSSKSFGLGIALVLAAIMVFAATAQAQTPAEDQYGSPTDTSAVAGGAEGSAAASGNSAGASASGSSGAEEDVTGGVLPSTGGAPIYLGLAGMILVGTSATLWLRLRAESR